MQVEQPDSTIAVRRFTPSLTDDGTIPTGDERLRTHAWWIGDRSVGLLDDKALHFDPR